MNATLSDNTITYNDVALLRSIHRDHERILNSLCDNKKNFIVDKYIKDMKFNLHYSQKDIRILCLIELKLLLHFEILEKEEVIRILQIFNSTDDNQYLALQSVIHYYLDRVKDEALNKELEQNTDKMNAVYENLVDLVTEAKEH